MSLLPIVEVPDAILRAQSAPVERIDDDLQRLIGNMFETMYQAPGIGPDQLNIRTLIDRVAGGEVKELILAVNATVEGQTTAHYITDQLAGSGAKVTRLAHGVPVGGELDYLDDGTLSAAMKSRTPF